MDEVNGRMGFGWIRDSLGLFKAGKSVPWKGCYPVKVTEIVSVREALSWIKEMIIDNVDVETNAQLVITALHATIFHSEFNIIISGIEEA